MAGNQFLHAAFSRAFLMRNRSGPATAPVYQGLWRPMAPTWQQGAVTLVRNPDPAQYNSFKVVGKFKGAPGNPELPIMARYTLDRSQLLKMAKDGCDHDLQIHFGECQNPQDFLRGWNKILVLEAANITNYGVSDLGAFSPDERTVLNETVPFAGEDMYEITQLSFARKATVAVTREVMDIAVCDSVSCGLCGLPSDGCQVIFAVMRNGGASPGILNELVFSQDGGLTWNVNTITPMLAAETPNAVRCVGTNIVVVSGDDAALFYAAIANTLTGTQVWAEVTTGFVAGSEPLAVFSSNPSYTWIVGKLGYIYFTSDPTSGVAVQDAGVATAQNLNAIHGVDVLNIAAVGDSNAVVATANGGVTWASITGPAPGVNLNAIYMRDSLTWFVGGANGRLYYTTDGGTTWHEKAFPGSGAGVIYDIRFVNRTVGYMAHATAAPAGRILRTIDGGFSWYVLPEGTGAIPANARVTALATCPDPNVVYGAGLATGNINGIIVEGA